MCSIIGTRPGPPVIRFNYLALLVTQSAPRRAILMSWAPFLLSSPYSTRRYGNKKHCMLRLCDVTQLIWIILDYARKFLTFKSKYYLYKRKYGFYFRFVFSTFQAKAFFRRDRYDFTNVARIQINLCRLKKSSY